tara:strand:- start:1366 stop:2049 length:684 start_codon:yes stop_codon:yes gene_type:complete
MAERPIYLPNACGDSLVEKLEVQFKWHAGLSISQKQKSIRSLHESAISKIGETEILEISSKSETEIGKNLSAFNLKFPMYNGKICTVECAYQGSKKFKNGGPYIDLYGLESRSAKQDIRIRNGDLLIAFEYDGEEWPLEPQTCFYDWIYIRALHLHEGLREAVLEYSAFTDIEFNPKKSINCQAQAVARYVALEQQGLIQRVLADQEFFISTYGKTPVIQSQGNLNL